MAGAPPNRPSHVPMSASAYRPPPVGGGRPSVTGQPSISSAPLGRAQPPNRQTSSPQFSSSANPFASSSSANSSNPSSSSGSHPPPLFRPSTTSIVRIGPPLNQQYAQRGPIMAAERPIRSSSEEELKNRMAMNSLTVQPSSSRPSLGAGASASPRPINTSLLSMYDSRSAQPHSAGVVINKTSMNRSSSGTSLSTLTLQVTPSASPVSGSAAAAYALSAGLDASPASSSPLPGHSHTVSSYPQSGSSALVSPFDDVDGDIPTLVECYENQRYYPVVGWSSRLLPTDRPNWSNDEGTQAKQFTDFKCPPGWSWVSDWRIDKGAGSGADGSGDKDGEGWSYTVEFTREWKGEAARGSRNLVRRRRWVRKRQANTKTVEQQRRSNQQLMPTTASNLAANSLTVGSSARSGTAGGGLRAPLPINSNSLTFNKAPVSSAITRAAVTAPLSSLYSMGPAMATEKKRRTISAIVKVVEYQRWYPIGGWKDQLLPTDGKPLWEDMKARPTLPKDRILANPKPRIKRQSSTTLSTQPTTSNSAATSELNSSTSELNTSTTSTTSAADEEDEPQWQWLGEWQADVTPSTDKDGWLYAIDFRNARWVGRKGIEHCVRKRVWVREKEKEEKRRDGRKVVEELFGKLERWERDVAEEEQNEDLIKLGSAAW